MFVVCFYLFNVHLTGNTQKKVIKKNVNKWSGTKWNRMWYFCIVRVKVEWKYGEKWCKVLFSFPFPTSKHRFGGANIQKCCDEHDD